MMMTTLMNILYNEYMNYANYIDFLYYKYCQILAMITTVYQLQ